MVTFPELGSTSLSNTETRVLFLLGSVSSLKLFLKIISNDVPSSSTIYTQLLPSLNRKGDIL